LNILKEKRLLPISYSLVAGLLFGLGFHTYISFRVAPLILVAVSIPLYFVFRRENLRKKFIASALLFIVAATVAALPIGLYFLEHPADFLGRAGGVSVFQAANPLGALLTSLGAHLAMFNFVGDFNWRHNIAGAPALFWPVGFCFLIGLFYSFKELFLSFRKDSPKFAVYGFLLVFWFVMLLPGILTSEAVPHSLRTIGAIPSTFILAGLGASLLFERLQFFIRRQNTFNFNLLTGSFALLLSAFLLASYFNYFVVWAQNREIPGAFSADLSAIGFYLNSLPDNVKKYVIVNLDGVLVNNLPMPAQTPIFIERVRFGAPRATYLKTDELSAIKPGKEKTVIVPLHPDAEIFDRLNSIFPAGVVEKESGIERYEI
jgi:hypothetical protein